MIPKQPLPLPPCRLSWASAWALAPKVCSTPKLFLVSLPKEEDSASGAPGWRVARMSFLPRICKKLIGKLKKKHLEEWCDCYEIISWSEIFLTSWVPSSNICILNLSVVSQVCGETATCLDKQEYISIALCNNTKFCHLITMSTHFCPRIFPSGSTTAYFLGLLQRTLRKSWVRNALYLL